MEAATIKATDSWYRELKDDRLEVKLVGQTPDGVVVKIRASGPKDQMWQVAAMFEDMTGTAVNGSWLRPPRSGAKPLEGQLTIIEALEETDEDYGEE